MVLLLLLLRQEPLRSSRPRRGERAGPGPDQHQARPTPGDGVGGGDRCRTAGSPPVTVTLAVTLTAAGSPPGTLLPSTSAQRGRAPLQPPLLFSGRRSRRRDPAWPGRNAAGPGRLTAARLDLLTVPVWSLVSLSEVGSDGFKFSAFRVAGVQGPDSEPCLKSWPGLGPIMVIIGPEQSRPESRSRSPIDYGRVAASKSLPLESP